MIFASSTIHGPPTRGDLVLLHKLGSKTVIGNNSINSILLLPFICEKIGKKGVNLKNSSISKHHSSSKQCKKKEKQRIQK
jgi:hypothetical protein